MKIKHTYILTLMAAIAVIGISIASFAALQGHMTHAVARKEMTDRFAGMAMQLIQLSNEVLFFNKPERAVRQWQELHTQIGRLGAPGKATENAKDADLFQRSMTTLNEMDALIETTATGHALLADDSPAAARLIESQLFRKSVQLQSLLRELTQHAESELNHKVEDIKSQMLRVFVLFAGVFALLGLVASYLFNRKVLQPIEQLEKVIDQLAEGNQEHRARIFSNDEIGHLATAFNSMADRLIRHACQLKEAAEEIAQHRDHLEDLVEERTQQLSEMKLAAEAANLSKSAFLANMSHEIRTPLNALTGMAHLLRRSGLNRQQIDKLDKIESAGSHLLEIINAILDLSKIEAGKFTLESAPVHIDTLFGNIGSILMLKAKEKGIAFNIESAAIPHNLLGDTTRLQQVLLNYVANAIKFTEQGHVTLRVKEESQTSETVTLRFEVEDTGIGIAPENLTRVFSAFEQAEHSMTRRYGGTGLGLAITRKITGLMGGAVGVDSILGKGSTFWCTVVLKKSLQAAATPVPAAARKAEQAIRQGHAGKRVLLAEDEPINREIMLMMLEDVGLAVDLAEDGLVAVDKANSAGYDLILMDMQMPNLDGLSATRTIRAGGPNADTPILATTANAFAEDRQLCLAAGMNDFIAKPISPRLFYDMLLE